MTEWEKKIDAAVDLLSEAFQLMNKDELERYGFDIVNPAYEQLHNVLLKEEHRRRELQA